jgi:hypothetical protein
MNEKTFNEMSGLAFPPEAKAGAWINRRGYGWVVADGSMAGEDGAAVALGSTARVMEVEVHGSIAGR